MGCDCELVSYCTWYLTFFLFLSYSICFYPPSPSSHPVTPINSLPQGVLEDTIIVMASDNGGCPAGGGRNYPLRGTKGSLFEGGWGVGVEG